MIAFDFQNLLSRWRGRVLDLTSERSLDFTLIVPLYGHPRFFDKRDRLLLYKRHVLVAIEISEIAMADFAEQLEREGWRVKRIHLAETPNPATLMKEALPEVTTEYVLRLDADSIVDEQLPQAVAAVAASGADI